LAFDCYCQLFVCLVVAGSREEGFAKPLWAIVTERKIVVNNARNLG